ncbi:DUF1573 domain-containing protein [Tautonia sp. JC769]|uniref:DUF1573 domain-containing protein n=1 Tax=Tautonia sp. JC769 TaxID=3232135 RepID=UPI00345988BF
MWAYRAIAGFGCLVVGLSSPWLSQRQQGAPGHLVAEQSRVEWGGQPPDDTEAEYPDRPTFVLTNVGDFPVRILSARSSCGCVAPKVGEAVVPPGGRTSVTVEPQPTEVGDREVLIEIEADSPAEPWFELGLRLTGGRRLPYLYRVSGDLNFRWEGDPSGMEREVFVEMVGTRAMPQPTSDLNFLRFGTATVDSDPGVLVRRDCFPVILGSSPPDEFVGEVGVVDPWLPSRVQSIRVLGRADAPLRAIPPRLLLGGDADSGARFFVKSAGPRPRLHATDQADGPAPLQIIPVEDDDTPGLHAFEIRKDRGMPIREGGYSIRAEVDESPVKGLTIPVLVKVNEEVDR